MRDAGTGGTACLQTPASMLRLRPPHVFPREVRCHALTDFTQRPRYRCL
jgi:hypothetical protein